MGIQSELVRILIAPDSFKEHLSATDASFLIAEVCEDIARERHQTFDCEVIPFSDGGEGLLDALAFHYDTQELHHNVQNPMGAATQARWSVLRDDPGWLASNPLLALGKAILGSLLMPDVFAGSSLDHRKIGLIESAQAIGLHLVPPQKRNPVKLSSFGIGELITRSLEKNVGRIWIGLGGSATVDGGLGALHALGARCFDINGNPVPSRSQRPVAKDLLEIHEIDLSGLDPRLTDTNVTLLCDVDNPLLGEHGAAPIFGPQKGATPESIHELELGLSNLAGALQNHKIPLSPLDDMTGAAGGVAFGLGAALGASLVPGAMFLMDVFNMADRMLAADLLITGEGRLDTTSFHGKATGALIDLAAQSATPSLILAGQATPQGLEMAQARGTQVHTLVRPGVSLEEAISQTSEHLRSVARESIENVL